MKKIIVPAEVNDFEIIASVSGGKDSTALMLVLREAGLPFRAVFADTGWEAPETYEYINTLRTLIGPIDVVQWQRTMQENILHRAGFPARMLRWCTQEQKVKPLRKYHDSVEEETGRETLNVVGIRAEESQHRAKMSMWEDDDKWGGYVWRPLLDWSVEDVIAVHKRHNVPMNPLYHQGYDRVGCFPCIFSRKEEIRLLPEWRIAEIEELERLATEERTRRKAVDPERYKDGVTTFFQTRVPGTTMGIREIFAWSKTARGGKKLDILAEIPQGGCMRWGICESPKSQQPEQSDTTVSADDEDQG